MQGLAVTMPSKLYQNLFICLTVPTRNFLQGWQPIVEMNLRVFPHDQQVGPYHAFYVLEVHVAPRHNCRKIGHMKKDCPKKTENTGNRQHSNTNRSQSTIATQQISTDGAGGDATCDNPLDYLYSDSGKEKQAPPMY